MPRTLRLAAPVALAGVVLAGCAAPDLSGSVTLPSVAAAAPAAAKSAGVHVTGTGYTFTAPAGFTAAPATEGVDAGAVGPAAAGVQPTVTVRVGQLPAGTSLQAAVAQETEALTAQGMTGVRTMSGTALQKVRFTQLVGTHTGLKVTVRSLVLVRTPKSGPPTATVLTFTVPQGTSAKELKALMAPVLKSWRWR